MGDAAGAGAAGDAHFDPRGGGEPEQDAAGACVHAVPLVFFDGVIIASCSLTYLCICWRRRGKETHPANRRLNLTHSLHTQQNIHDDLPLPLSTPASTTDTSTSTSTSTLPPPLLPACVEAARLLSAALTEDPHCLSPSDVLNGLPTIRRLVELSASDRCPPHLPLPWIDRALSASGDEEGGAAAMVEQLVDQGWHLWLADALLSAEEGTGGWPLRPRLTALSIWHAMLNEGGRVVPCLDHDCSLAQHPHMRALLPRLAAAVADAQAPFPLRLHCAFVMLSLVVGEGGGDALYKEEEETGVLMKEGVIEGLGDVLVVGRRAGWGEEDKAEEEEEEREEDRYLWSRVVGMVAAAPSDYRGRVTAVVGGRYGRREREAVGEILLEAMAGQEAEISMLSGRG